MISPLTMSGSPLSEDPRSSSTASPAPALASKSTADILDQLQQHPGSTLVVTDESGHITGSVDLNHFIQLLKRVESIDAAASSKNAATSDIPGSHAHASQSTRTAADALSHEDLLTHIPNRLVVSDRIQQAIALAQRQGNTLAVCHLDIDNFKGINEKYGKAIADTLIHELGFRIRNSLRNNDTIARVGGDEFLLLLGDFKHPDELEQTLTRLLALIATPCTVAGQLIAISASMGATVAPTDSDDPDTLLRHADQAMYVAKQEGGNRYNLFDIEKNLKVREQRDTQVRILQAIENKELRLYYQPKVNMRSGTITGFEALIRWQHPERGILPPAEFLPQTENHDSCIAIGKWVMEEALHQLAHWAKEGLTLPVSINIAAYHLQHPDFVSDLSQLLTRMTTKYPHLQPHWLELEILETAALNDMAYVAKVMDECLALGIGFALDDFGTGYSSLSYLKQLKASTLKIDQSFVRDMLENSDDLAIVEGVVGLTSAFRRKVIAEGVETIQHGMMLMHLGCDLAQGYGIARPMPADHVLAWVASFTPPAAWFESLAHPWSRDDFPLLSIEFEHRQWMDELLALLKKPASPLHALTDDFFDPSRGRFGQWCLQQGKTRFGHMREFATISQIHEHVYHLGRRIAQLHLDHKADLAEELISHLNAANEDFFDGIHELRQEMANLADMPPTHWVQIHSA